MTVRVLFFCWIMIAGCGRVGYARVEADSAMIDADTSTPRDTSTPDADDAGDGSIIDTGVDTGPCSEEPCRLVVPQCGCAEMCGWDTFRPRVCVAAGTIPVGQNCTRDHECVPGAGCIFLGTGPGVCYAFCESRADCDPLSKCVRLSWPDPIGVCSSTCDPAASTGCTSPTACGIGLAFQIPGEATVTVALCANPGRGTTGDSCSGPLDCAEGFTCFAIDCRPLCRMGDAACPTCTSFTPPAIRGEVEYGACL